MESVVSAVDLVDGLTEAAVREVVFGAFAENDLTGKRVLAVIPDGTRTAPVPLLFRLLREALEEEVAGLDYLVALGTHPPMDDRAMSRLVGVPVEDGVAGKSRVLNHRWDVDDTFATLGVLPATEVTALSGGRLSLEVPIRLNRLVGDARKPQDQRQSRVSQAYRFNPNHPLHTGGLLGPVRVKQEK